MICTRQHKNQVRYAWIVFHSQLASHKVTVLSCNLQSHGTSHSFFHRQNVGQVSCIVTKRHFACFLLTQSSSKGTTILNRPHMPVPPVATGCGLESREEAPQVAASRFRGSLYCLETKLSYCNGGFDQDAVLNRKTRFPDRVMDQMGAKLIQVAIHPTSGDDGNWFGINELHWLLCCMDACRPRLISVVSSGNG